MCQPGAEGLESKKQFHKGLSALNVLFSDAPEQKSWERCLKKATTSLLVPWLRQTFAVISKSCLIFERNKQRATVKKLPADLRGAMYE